MSNDYDEHEDYQIFSPADALENFADQEDFMVNQLTKGLEAFQNGGLIIKLIDTYKTFNWTIIGSEGWEVYHRDVHSLKGRFRYMSLKLLERRFHTLEHAVQGGHTLQVGVMLEKCLQACRPTQIAVLEYLKLPQENLFTYDPNELSMWYIKLERGYLKQSLKFRPQIINIDQTDMLAKHLALNRDENLMQMADEDDQLDEQKPEIKCIIF